MCANHGFNLSWNFSTYCNYAHFSATGIQEEICSLFPQILKRTTWEALYQEKKEVYLTILNECSVSLMAGVELLLKWLEIEEIPCCVVTHSPLRQTLLIREQIPLLKTIPHWVTREDYTRPKPASEGYLTAIERHGNGVTSIVGFEDSKKGLASLVKAPVDAYLISSVLSKAQVAEIREQLGKFFFFHSSFQEFFGQGNSLI